MGPRYIRLLLLAACVLAAGCPRPSVTPPRAPVTKPEEALLEPVPPLLELRDDGEPAALRTAIAESLAWLRTRPAQGVLGFNESYVFFRFLESAAVGSLGRPVTPGRSIATDARLFPRGALAFISTEQPAALPDGTVGWRPLSRFVLNQDTGGAIKGAGRVDVFWGRGPEAELAAGMMKQKGRLIFFVPRRAAPVAGGTPAQ